jgi:hypothetical protein
MRARSERWVSTNVGAIRREYLDRVLFWNTVDLARKLEEFRSYYNNESRCHQSLSDSALLENLESQRPARYAR